MYVKKLVYPIFLNCCQYTDDIFWEDIFADLAFGKPPFGTYLSKDFLCCSLKQKEFNYKIENKDSVTVYKEVFYLLRNRLGIFSRQEKVPKISDFKKWNDIKKKNLKKLLIELFVIRMKTKHSLSITQTRNLLSTILNALVFKVITTTDIDYSNGRINKIEGINFSKNK